jgi:hypothetical protein
MLLDCWRTFQDWEAIREDYGIRRPTKDTLYGWTRPGPRRAELLRDQVLSRDDGRWLFNFSNYNEHVAKKATSLGMSS